jgi:dsRNA-specific ribonuclease
MHPLLRNALTHRSSLPVGDKGSNRCLSLLGDKVLNALIALEMTQRTASSGGKHLTQDYYTRVSTKFTQDLAQRWGLRDRISWTPPPQVDGQTRVLSETVEAVLGATFLMKDGDIRRLSLEDPIRSN